MAAGKFFIFPVLLGSLMLSGCEVMDPLMSAADADGEMDCEELDRLAEEDIKSGRTPFFASQSQFPADWRNYGTDRWIREGSRQLMRIGKKEFIQADVLEGRSSALHEQRIVKARIEANVCKNAARRPDASLSLSNFQNDAPEKFNETLPVNFRGKASADVLARLLCGFEKIPAVDKNEAMARLWLACQKRKPINESREDETEKFLLASTAPEHGYSDEKLDDLFDERSAEDIWSADDFPTPQSTVTQALLLRESLGSFAGKPQKEASAPFMTANSSASFANSGNRAFSEIKKSRASEAGSYRSVFSKEKLSDLADERASEDLPFEYRLACETPALSSEKGPEGEALTFNSLFAQSEEVTSSEVSKAPSEAGNLPKPAVLSEEKLADLADEAASEDLAVEYKLASETPVHSSGKTLNKETSIFDLLFAQNEEAGNPEAAKPPVKTEGAPKPSPFSEEKLADLADEAASEDLAVEYKLASETPVHSSGKTLNKETSIFDLLFAQSEEAGNPEAAKPLVKTEDAAKPSPFSEEKLADLAEEAASEDLSFEHRLPSEAAQPPRKEERNEELSESDPPFLLD